MEIIQWMKADLLRQNPIVPMRICRCLIRGRTLTVRIASLQQREKKHKLVTNILMIIVLMLCSIAGYSAMGTERIILVNDSITTYFILMAVSFLIVFLVGISGDNVADNNCKLEKNMKIVEY